ncbi:MAG TPA: hypothetical protein VHW96_06305 [Solirubrobacteraceae bacterium]|jgi:hypothetical protein|nr:hypothetical protein [Solirubrobacteraceae bacterium]
MWRELGRTAVGRRVCLCSGLTAILAMALCASALGAGKAINIATPFDIWPPGPSVAVDSAGNAIIAWANDKDLAGAPDLVQYCVVPAGGSACAHSGSLTAADSAGHVDAVRVLDDGGTLVLLADVFGAAGNNAGDFTPEQEWQSTDDGATWTQQAGGLSVGSGILNADTVPVDGVILPGTGALGYGWVTAGGAPTFSAFPLAAPPECSVTTCPAGFATLEPATNPDQLSNEPGHFASISSGPNGGVMGVFDSVETNGPLGCADSFGTAFVYGSGNQSPSNNYNVSPGQPNTAWRVPVTQADCNLEYSAVGGGPSGFGVLADDLANKTVVYHRFDAATSKFDTPLATVNGTAGELYPAVNQDAEGNLFATYLLGGSLGKVELSYSADGGKTWTGAPLDSDTNGTITEINSSINAKGQGWVAWLSNGSVFAQSFQASDAITPASVGGGATTNGSTVNLDVTCASYPCTITITLTAPETVVVNAHTAAVAAKKGKKRTRIVTLGKGKFTLTKAGGKKLSVKLSGTGKKFLASRKGHVKITGLFSETLQKHTTQTKRTLTLAIKPRKGKK